jgi:pimeloyl-ACP methyl ester carboxylesterase
VQLLVHGATYNHAYWDWPSDPARYSYVRAAVRAGYATFAVDRLGAGESSHPPSATLTPESEARALHDVVSALRSGAIGGVAFDRVVWVGHSLGSMHAWLEASMFKDVDAFVLTGMLHSAKPSFIDLALRDAYPALLDPVFADAGLDDGYLTTTPGAREELFYYRPTADPSVIAGDEQRKDVMSATEIGLAIPYFSSPRADAAPSRAIRVPTLLVVGEDDGLWCGPPDGFACTQATVAAREAPYYSSDARLTVTVVPRTGHDVQLHRTAPSSTATILRWLDQRRDHGARAGLSGI